MLRKIYTIIIVTVFMLCGVPGVHASGWQSQGFPKSNEQCQFSIQLREDPMIKRQYISLMTAVAQRIEYESPTVDEMSSDIHPASFEEYYQGDHGSSDSGRNAPIENLAGVDELSMICITCHDGISAQSIGVNVRNNKYNKGSFIHSKNFDHPIGMDYSQYASLGKGFKLIDINSSRMVFSKGKVGCLTCHNPLSSELSHLVMSDRRSALCITCHDK